MDRKDKSTSAMLVLLGLIAVFAGLFIPYAWLEFRSRQCLGVYDLWGRIDNNKDVRSIIREIRDGKNKTGIPLLLRLLNEPDYEISYRAIDALIELRRDRDSELRAREAGPELIRMLDKTGNDIRFKTISALGALGVKESIPALINALTDDDPMIRGISAVSLGVLQSKEAAPRLINLLDDKHYYVRESAVCALGIIGDKQAIPKLMSILTYEDHYLIRRYTVEALGKLKATEAKSQIIALLQDRDLGVRYKAVIALGKINARETIPELIKLLSHADFNFRKYAVGALADLGARETIPEIKKLLQDENESVRQAAEQALKTLGLPAAEIEQTKQK